MRILYGPIKALFSRPKAPQRQVPAPAVAAVPTAQESRAAENKAREEAERKERAKAAARQGQRTTLLTGPGTADIFSAIGKSGRRTLLGGPRQGG